MEYNLTLTENDLIVLNEVLMNGVYKDVAPLINKINMQIQKGAQYENNGSDK